MLIDTHCHIFSEYYDDIDDVILKCRERGIEKIIVSGCDMKTNREVLQLISKYDIVYGSLGLHPTELGDSLDTDLKFIDDNASNDKIVAIGEIGLDYHYDDTDKDKQKEVFRRQLEIATKHKKPIIVHSRDAISDTYNILREYKLKGSIHAFSGSLEMAQKFISLGYMLGVGGVSTYKNARVIKEVIMAIDLSYIILETDSPYLTPHPYRGSKNAPYNVSIIAEAVAGIKNVPISEVERVCTENAKRLFDFSFK